MIQISRILCPIDLSEPSHHALEHAVALARWYGAAITALHVFARVPVAAYAPGGGSPGAAFGEAERRRTLTDLEAFIDRQGDERVRIALSTRDGYPAAEILAEARGVQADLLVLGTHGRSGVERLLLGSVTEKVLRGADCPVLTVPPRSMTSSPIPVTYKRILCAVDFSESSMQALRYATSIAQEADATLTAVHVMEYGLQEWPELYETFMSNDRLDVKEFRSRAEASSRERLELAIPDAARTYCTVETVLAEGKPYREILRLAAERGAGLIVMGVTGRSPADLTVFGSTTQNVVRAAACPVLTLRGQAGA
jgi:nucleotide-binding universal stress UspA family protein